MSTAGPNAKGLRQSPKISLMPLEKAEEINKPFSWIEPFNYASKLLCESPTSLDMPGW
jgi:hypothetical protein